MSAVHPEVARALAVDWIAAWNAHDIERILSHYTDDVRLSSPFVTSIAGVETGVVAGKSALSIYWQKALAMLPDLHFTLIDVLAGVNAVTIYYRGHRGTVAETFQLDTAGQVWAAAACYGVGG